VRSPLFFIESVRCNEIIYRVVVNMMTEKHRKCRLLLDNERPCIYSRRLPNCQWLLVMVCVASFGLPVYIIGSDLI
jgi:hypothetical protein